LIAFEFFFFWGVRPLQHKKKKKRKDSRDRVREMRNELYKEYSIIRMLSGERESDEN
jgi:hypothetical protein